MSLSSTTSQIHDKAENSPEVTGLLKEIADCILSQMRAGGDWQQVVDMTTSHTYRDKWTRISIKKEILEKWRQSRILNIDVMAVEVIIVDGGTDMTDEIHHHDNAHAYVVLLGAEEGFEEPDGVYFFGSTRPMSAIPGTVLDILSGTLHGFSAPGKKKLAFLSVQSRRIEEDYHLLKVQE